MGTSAIFGAAHHADLPRRNPLHIYMVLRVHEIILKLLCVLVVLICDYNFLELGALE